MLLALRLGFSVFVVEMAIGKLNRHKSPGIDQLQAEFIIARGRTIFCLRSLNILILFGIKRKSLRSGRSQSLYPSLIKVIKQKVVIIGAYHICQLSTKCFQHLAVNIIFLCRGTYRDSIV
jgi:hypothetical protein